MRGAPVFVKKSVQRQAFNSPLKPLVLSSLLTACRRALTLH
jgi:hypothetical protein